MSVRIYHECECVGHISSIFYSRVSSCEEHEDLPGTVRPDTKIISRQEID